MPRLKGHTGFTALGKYTDQDPTQIMKYFTDGNPHTLWDIHQRAYWMEVGLILWCIQQCMNHGLLTLAPLPDNERQGWRATEMGKDYFQLR